MGDELDRLFLFEFMVHSVNYFNSTLRLDNDFLRALGPTCVQFKARYLPKMTLCEDDFCEKSSFQNYSVRFKAGKSCLFSLGDTCISDRDIQCEISVKRKLPDGNSATHYCIGKSPIQLNSKFIGVLNSSGSTPLSQCIKACLDLKNNMNETVGNVMLLLRITCFGTVIVTEFQKNCDDSKAFLFKGDKIVPVDEDDQKPISDDNYAPKTMAGDQQMPLMAGNPYGQNQYPQMPPMNQFGQMQQSPMNQYPQMQQQYPQMQQQQFPANPYGQMQQCPPNQMGQMMQYPQAGQMTFPQGGQMMQQNQFSPMQQFPQQQFGQYPMYGQNQGQFNRPGYC